MSLKTYPDSPSSPFAALSFDFGTQRIGVAFGQSLTGTARPVCILKAKDGIPDWDEIVQLIKDWKPDALVIGLPYNLDGTEKRAVYTISKICQPATREISSSLLWYG